jgi:hypothetical protein
MQSEKIYHYTSIDSLALILQSRKIRFARLDTVDDVTEAQTHAGVNFGKYFFVSCWTKEETENIAQWKMYGGDMGGIRIELPTNPFRKIKLESIRGFTVDSSRQYISPLSTKELFGKSYSVTPMMPYGDDYFSGEVEYVNDVEARWAAAVSRRPDYSGRRSSDLEINKMFSLVRLKNDVWNFQSEYRFFLHAMPMTPPFEPDGTNIPTVEQLLSTSAAMQQNIDPGVTYIDVPISDEAVSQLVIRTGPLCTPAGHICIDALVEKLAPGAVVEASHLTGRVRGRGN